jgi:hypothetical protein
MFRFHGSCNSRIPSSERIGLDDEMIVFAPVNPSGLTIDLAISGVALTERRGHVKFEHFGSPNRRDVVEVPEWPRQPAGAVV